MQGLDNVSVDAKYLVRNYVLKLSKQKHLTKY